MFFSIGEWHHLLFDRNALEYVERRLEGNKKSALDARRQNPRYWARRGHLHRVPATSPGAADTNPGLYSGFTPVVSIFSVAALPWPLPRQPTSAPAPHIIVTHGREPAKRSQTFRRYKRCTRPIRTQCEARTRLDRRDIGFVVSWYETKVPCESSAVNTVSDQIAAVRVRTFYDSRINTCYLHAKKHTFALRM